MQMLSSTLFQLLSFVVVLGVVVLFHEFGHYLAARLIGVRVEVFSIGFGPRLFGWRRGRTDYRVSLVPLGGYVRMAGEGSLEGEPTGAADEFESRRSWEKMVILAAGPVFNVVLAVGLASSAAMLGIREPAFLAEPVVVAGLAPDSPARSAGLLEGDRILAVDGKPIPDWSAFQEAILVRPGQAVRLEVEREGRRLRLPLEVATVGKSRVGDAGILPWCRVELATVVAGSPAQAAGLRPGDRIETVDGERVCSTGQLSGLLQEAGAAPHVFGVWREDGEALELSMAPRLDQESGRYLIGIAARPPPLVTRRHPPAEALVVGLQRTWHDTGLVFETLRGLVTGRLSLRAMSGPVEIAEVTSDAVQLGLVPVLLLMALISLNLGILNLLPIPVLDGGRIAIVAVEAVRGRELAAGTKEWILRAGFVMILALMVVVIALDFVKKIEG